MEASAIVLSPISCPFVYFAEPAPPRACLSSPLDSRPSPAQLADPAAWPQPKDLNGFVALDERAFYNRGNQYRWTARATSCYYPVDRAKPSRHHGCTAKTRKCQPRGSETWRGCRYRASQCERCIPMSEPNVTHHVPVAHDPFSKRRWWWWKAALPIGLLLAVIAVAAVYVLFAAPVRGIDLAGDPRASAVHRLRHGAGGGGNKAFFRTQMELIRSRWILGLTVASDRIKLLPEIRKAPDPIDVADGSG